AGCAASPKVVTPLSAPAPAAEAKREDASLVAPAREEDSVPDAAPFHAGPPASHPPAAVPATCAKPGVFVELAPGPPAECASLSCLVEVPFRIVNCTAETVVPRRLALMTDGVGAAVRRLSPEAAEE